MNLRERPRASAAQIELKVRMRYDDGWALCRLEVLSGDLVVEETGATGTTAVARAAGVLVERLADRGQVAKIEDILAAIERAMMSAIARHAASGAAS